MRRTFIHLGNVDGGQAAGDHPCDRQRYEHCPTCGVPVHPPCLKLSAATARKRMSDLQSEETVYVPEAADYPDIDARSENLLDEWHQHYDECTALLLSENPDDVEPAPAMNREKVLEGWVAQKLSYLPLLAEYQNNMLILKSNRLPR